MAASPIRLTADKWWNAPITMDRGSETAADSAALPALTTSPNGPRLSKPSGFTQLTTIAIERGAEALCQLIMPVVWGRQKRDLRVARGVDFGRTGDGCRTGDAGGEAVGGDRGAVLGARAEDHAVPGFGESIGQAISLGSGAADDRNGVCRHVRARAICGVKGEGVGG